ncbi:MULTISPECIES: HesA/MoeB/ThiF family protein [unclassified Leptospira]|uniref:HesA/MoeB/ThiF family protein n=1 Tax=unclassified Leptospira TaxID=2633828 RepID=UPI0002BE41A9|nr:MULTISPECIES: HesA/MoeB/ThiF family protein [unclassified Leptospira]EMJ98613.1 ThiF family protein [Leptospira sp. B5-022]MCR1792621.1 HesA/MoeB/ThiF family protein [Leptospira sp. id769339]
MSPEQKKYFSRQTKLPFLGESGQKQLLQKSALVIGLGGLGSPASLHLATAGVGRLGLWDFDSVELSNLHRQTAFTLSDIGRKKTEVTEEYIQARVPGVQLETFTEIFSEKIDPSIFKNWDIILDCTDQIQAKYTINRFCIQTHKPLVTASVFRTSAQIAIFSPQGRPCYKCLYPNLEGSDLLSCEDGGVLGVQTAIAGLYQASFAIQYLLFPEKSPTHSAFQLEWESPLLYETFLEADPNCTECGSGKREETLKVEIDLNDWKEWKKDPRYILLDVREFEERKEMPIGNSVFSPLSELSLDVALSFSKEKTYITICESGIRSKKAAKILKDAGLTAYSLQGGRKILALEEII